MKKKFISIIFLILISAGAVLFLITNDSEQLTQDRNKKPAEKQTVEEIIPAAAPVTPVEAPTQIKKNTKQEVPFISQAPSGKWSDPIYQNGCEEASMIMAMGWLKEKYFDVKEAEDEIKKLTQFEQEFIGKNIDTSLTDTVKIFKQFYKHEKVYSVENINKENMLAELEKGNILLVPVYGRDLKNPNFTQPGPITHMLVVVGYDGESKNFITNDPGTRKGQNFAYNEEILFNSIWMYDSSNSHDQIPQDTRKKGMIIMEK